MNNPKNPFTEPPPAEITLREAPLVRVIMQVRFPPVFSIEKQDFIAPFQEEIRRDYPVLRPEHKTGIVIDKTGVTESKTSQIWRFHSIDKLWCVSLSSDFLALDTTRYESRTDFINRFEKLLKALQKNIEPQVIDRLGVRYIDRITGANLKDDLPELVRTEVSGILSSSIKEHLNHAISENLFTLPGDAGYLKARWGFIPPGSTIDPAVIELSDKNSWLLDLDAFFTESQPFDVKSVTNQARKFSEQIYSFFRWSVTDVFLTRYGADL